MAGDVQLRAPQVSAAPLDYVVPGSALIRLKAVRAEFTDNSAAGTWLPAVQLISDSGHIIATASDQNASVAAGGSADASFFPGVKPSAAAASTATGLAWAQAHSTPAGESIASDSLIHYFDFHDVSSGARFETSDATTFANASTTAFTGSAVWGIQVLKAGTYLWANNFQWFAQGTTGIHLDAYWSLSNGSAPSFYQAGRTSALTGDNWDHGAAAPGLPHMFSFEYVSFTAGQVPAVGASYARVSSGGASTVSSQMWVTKISDYVATHASMTGASPSSNGGQGVACVS